MKADASIKLVSQLLDLPLIDKDERWCGIVDDVELVAAGKETRVKALLVGPGAYAARMPSWMFWFVRKIASDRVSRVPFDQIADIGSAVRLKGSAEKLGLHRVEDRFRRWIPRRGAL